MNNRLTDKQYIIASQIAYLNISSQDIIDATGEDGELPTLRDILVLKGGQNVISGNREDAYSVHYCYQTGKEGMNEIIPFIDGIIGIEASEKEIDNSVYMSTGEVFDLDVNNCLKKEFGQKEYYVLECADWIVQSVEDLNDSSGMYAITLIPSRESNVAIVAYRGSEAANNKGFSADKVVTDWIVADAGIASGKPTLQEIQAADYLEEILSDDRFTQVYTCGHSLGGNLALTAAVMKAYDNDKFKGGVAFDAPGHPQEFIDSYSTNISKVADKLTHYYYTMVGSLFNSLTSNYKEIQVLEEHFGGFESHSLFNIDMNGEDVIEIEPQDSLNYLRI